MEAWREVHNLYSYIYYGDQKKEDEIGTSEGNRSLGKADRGWEGIIKMNLSEIGRGDMSWTYLA